MLTLAFVLLGAGVLLGSVLGFFICGLSELLHLGFWRIARVRRCRRLRLRCSLASRLRGGGAGRRLIWRHRCCANRFGGIGRCRVLCHSPSKEKRSGNTVGITPRSQWALRRSRRLCLSRIEPRRLPSDAEQMTKRVCPAADEREP